MKFKNASWRLATVALVVMLGACGGGSGGLGTDGDNTGGVGTPGNGGGSDAGSTISALDLRTSAIDVGSSPTSEAIVTAVVKDKSNRLVEGAKVDFTADSGELEVTQAITDASGKALARLRAGSDYRNRTITVTASAEGASDKININVVGTTMTVSGPTSIPLDEQVDYVIQVTDSEGNAVPGVAVAVRSDKNDLKSNNLNTDNEGQARVTVTGKTDGADTISASALGLTVTKDIHVSGDSFSITSPDHNEELPLNSPVNVILKWTNSEGAVIGEDITFTTTRGAFTHSPTARTGNSGEATVELMSTTAGYAVIRATNKDKLVAERTVEFVSEDANTIVVQASRAQIRPNESTRITATVRDANQNLVKNADVTFVLEDVTAGTLSNGSVTTNSYGQASTTYTAGNSSSSESGVSITASVRDSAGEDIADTISLTVSGSALWVSLGTGNDLEEPNPTQYYMPWSVQVSDSSGNAVKGAPVMVRVIPVAYGYGSRQWDGSSWQTTPDPWCRSEDLDRDGILDEGEDDNRNGKLEPGVVAHVSAISTTDETGSAFFNLMYAQQYAYWAEVEIIAEIEVAGTEHYTSQRVLLPGIANDFNNENTAPPGEVSPWGAVYPADADTPTCPSPAL